MISMKMHLIIINNSETWRPEVICKIDRFNRLQISKGTSKTKDFVQTRLLHLHLKEESTFLELSCTHARGWIVELCCKSWANTEKFMVLSLMICCWYWIRFVSMWLLKKRVDQSSHWYGNVDFLLKDCYRHR